MRYRHIIGIAVLAGVAACGDASGPSHYSAAGSWAGQETGGPTHVVLTLTQKHDSVYGTGTLNAGEGVTSPQIQVTVTGSVATTDFVVDLKAEHYQPLHLIGAFTGRNDVEAYMIGSGYYGEQILLHRQ